MYALAMNDHESMFDDRSRWGSCAADLDEMPPEDFDTDYRNGEEFSIGSYLLTLAMVASVMFIMFKFL